MQLLVSTNWLAQHPGREDVKIVDATYFALDPNRDAGAEYRQGHIPGARFLGLSELKDPSCPDLYMIPSAEVLSARMVELGLRMNDHIVLYDAAPHITSARAWWMLHLFGLTNISLLDGGLGKWKAEGRPLVSEAETRGSTSEAQRLSFEAKCIRSKAQMIANLASGTEQVADARSTARFTGEENDPRGLPTGHIPGSRSLPYNRLFNADGTWKTGEALAAEFSQAGIDLDNPLVTSCGSGVTAAVLVFGAALLGKQDVALYDGSWSEWASDPATPKATGAA